MREDEENNLKNTDGMNRIPPEERVGKFEAVIILICAFLLFLSPFMFHYITASYGDYTYTETYSVGDFDDSWHLITYLLCGMFTLIALNHVYYEKQTSKYALIFPVIGVIAIIPAVEHMIALDSRHPDTLQNLLFYTYSETYLGVEYSGARIYLGGLMTILAGLLLIIYGISLFRTLKYKSSSPNNLFKKIVTVILVIVIFQASVLIYAGTAEPKTIWLNGYEEPSSRIYNNNVTNAIFPTNSTPEGISSEFASKMNLQIISSYNTNLSEQWGTNWTAQISNFSDGSKLQVEFSSVGYETIRWFDVSANFTSNNNNNESRLELMIDIANKLDINETVLNEHIIGSSVASLRQNHKGYLVAHNDKWDYIRADFNSDGETISQLIINGIIYDIGPEYYLSKHGAELIAVNDLVETGNMANNYTIKSGHAYGVGIIESKLCCRTYVWLSGRYSSGSVGVYVDVQNAEVVAIHYGMFIYRF